MDAKKALLGLIVIFLGFWMFTDPDGLAAAGRDGAVAVWVLVSHLFRAVITFVGAL